MSDHSCMLYDLHITQEHMPTVCSCVHVIQTHAIYALVSHTRHLHICMFFMLLTDRFYLPYVSCSLCSFILHWPHLHGHHISLGEGQIFLKTRLYCTTYYHQLHRWPLVHLWTLLPFYCAVAQSPWISKDREYSTGCSRTCSSSTAALLSPSLVDVWCTATWLTLQIRRSDWWLDLQCWNHAWVSTICFTWESERTLNLLLFSDNLLSTFSIQMVSNMDGFGKMRSIYKALENGLERAPCTAERAASFSDHPEPGCRGRPGLSQIRQNEWPTKVCICSLAFFSLQSPDFPM